MSKLAQPVRVAVAGIGGFAASHHEALLVLEREGQVVLVAACDPRAESLSEICEQYQFRERGVQVWSDFDSMLRGHDDGIDCVIVASPSQFHARMHAACVERGLACYLEKPPTLDPAELEEMILRDASLPFATNVGFHFVHQEARGALRNRLVSGEFGPLRSASLLGLAARPLDYYQRNGWAGKLLSGDSLLLDSCFGNAMSHYVNCVLLLIGADQALPELAEVELYRAYEIETMDTVFARAVLSGGGEFRLAVSHACSDEYLIVERLEFERCVVEIHETNRYSIRYPSGEVEEYEVPFDTLEANLRDYFGYLNGVISRPAILLEECRGFVQLNALLYVAASKVADVSDEHLRREKKENFASELRCIEGVREAAVSFIVGEGFPSQSGYAWGVSGGKADATDLDGLREAVGRHLAASRRKDFQER